MDTDLLLPWDGSIRHQLSFLSGLQLGLKRHHKFSWWLQVVNCRSWHFSASIITWANFYNKSVSMSMSISTSISLYCFGFSGEPRLIQGTISAKQTWGSENVFQGKEKLQKWFPYCVGYHWERLDFNPLQTLGITFQSCFTGRLWYSTFVHGFPSPEDSPGRWFPSLLSYVCV